MVLMNRVFLCLLATQLAEVGMNGIKVTFHRLSNVIRPLSPEPELEMPPKKYTSSLIM